MVTHTKRLTFILNYLTFNTDDIELFRSRLDEYCGKDEDFRMRINNILESLKVDEK
jgi:hypothetical protein